MSSKCHVSLLVAVWLIAFPLGGQEPSIPLAEGDFAAEEVSFFHQGNRLFGTLHTPHTAGPHPAIVLLAGSGPTDRTSFGYFPHLQPAFLNAGIAVLSYDKPGVGASTGAWQEMTLRDRATEAVEAVRYLRTRDDIRADHVGLWGGSQGGWVAPLAATLSPEIAFVITISAPGVPPAEQDVYGLENRLRTDHPEEVVEEGVRWGQRLMKAAAEGWSFDKVKEELLDPAEEKPWGGYFTIPDADAWGFLSSVDPDSGTPNVLYDPVPVLSRMTTPFLAIFGETDDLVPVAKSVDILADALVQAENPDFEIVVFPEANHGILVGPRIFAPGYLEKMVEWLESRISL